MEQVNAGLHWLLFCWMTKTKQLALFLLVQSGQRNEARVSNCAGAAQKRQCSRLPECSGDG